jgi:hypothetical protein
MDKVTETLKSWTKVPELKEPSDAISVTRKVDQSKYTDQMPMYPGRTLAVHVATKGLQLGSIVGLALTPILAWRRRTSMVKVWRNFVPMSTLLGATVSTSMIYGKDLKGDMTVEGVDDRAYRIVKNKAQTKVDTYSAVGATAGAVTGVIVGGATVPLFCTGVALGVAAYATEKQYNANQPPPDA